MAFRKPNCVRDFHFRGYVSGGTVPIRRMIGSGSESRKRFWGSLTASKYLLFNKKEDSSRRGCGNRQSTRVPGCNQQRFQRVGGSPGDGEKPRSCPPRFTGGELHRRFPHFSPTPPPFIPMRAWRSSS